MGKQNKKSSTSFLVQGSILAIASIVSRIIGLIYRIPLPRGCRQNLQILKSLQKQ